MNKTKEALKLVKKVGSVAVEQNSYKWPPPCMGILHQPQRPKTKCNTVK
ncbi:cyclic lactone autoinducer peptide [Petralouisia muris]|uniref:Cyclic lactone autoinducer peptide n=1 Tax=Petralouisia muris TaxID=3032872 RepID=A0AC61RMK2_9FIRM|nr:cyclic lactone autoinducer peptide [Petralouisia muris]TGY87131.1 cyclic lactone autoinducer peptide [Petralouisia muris]